MGGVRDLRMLVRNNIPRDKGTLKHIGVVLAVCMQRRM
jgi:hypothetical protein